MAKKTHGKTASGKPITDDLVKQLGRPVMGSGPAGVESVRLDPELRDALDTRA